MLDPARAPSPAPPSTDPAQPPPARAPKLLDRVRAEIRTRRYSRRTEETYTNWIRRFVVFSGMRHPREMGSEEIGRFLTHLAVQGRVSAATQNQALSALLFLYRDVLRRELPWVTNVVRAKDRRKLPVVLTREEVVQVLERMSGTPRLMAMLLYGAGLRLLECCQLRVKDLDFGRGEIVVRAGKGGRDRVTMLPERVRPTLSVHLERVKKRHERDLREGHGWVELPGGLDRKYPNAGREWVWHWAFPAVRTYVDRETGERRRHHVHESVLQRAVREAVRVARITKPASCHTFRHSFATHLLEDVAFLPRGAEGAESRDPRLAGRAEDTWGLHS